VTSCRVQASVDALTGVRNRLSLSRDIGRIASDTSLFVMMVDVDDFKSINDVHGHAAGDEALRCLAHWLAALFGTGHTYRFGGDEFCVILPTADASALEQNIVQVEERCAADGLSVSCGYVLGQVRDSLDVHAMLGEADERLLAAKREGKARSIGGTWSQQAS